MYEEKFMREAIRLAVENVKQGTGGPFGAVVVKGERLSQLVPIRLLRIVTRQHMPK